MRPGPIVAASAVALLLGGAAAAVPAAGGLSPELESWFRKTTQTLFDAFATGDKSLWEKLLADDCIYTSETGEVLDRRKFLADLRPLPPGFSGQIKIEDMTFRSLGTATVSHYLVNEWEDVFGQKLHTKYLVTDTWRRDAGEWKLAASQTTVVPRDLDPVPVDKHGWPKLVGDYRLSPGDKRVYHVFLRDGALYGGNDEKSATELIPLSPLVYFQKGSIHTMIFVPGADGAIREVREEHKFNEVAMQRIP
jgi:hypothetical protein